MRPLNLPFISPVNGVSQYQTEVVLVAVGDRVSIWHDKANPYDSNACEVLFNNKRLGFIPKELAARLVLSGEKWDGEIVEVLEGKTRGLRVRVLEHLDADEAQEDPVEPAVEEEPRAVYSLGGRLLGKYLHAQDDTIVVLNAAEMEVPYPKTLVRVN